MGVYRVVREKGRTKSGNLDIMADGGVAGVITHPGFPATWVGPPDSPGSGPAGVVLRSYQHDARTWTGSVY